jgi:hypothetical protein
MEATCIETYAADNLSEKTIFKGEKLMVNIFNFVFFVNIKKIY